MFRTVVKALITHDGEVLIGQKKDEKGHPISGEWQAVQWVDPADLSEYLCAEQAARLAERPRQEAFVEELLA